MKGKKIRSITSPQNPRIKELRRLRDKRARDKTGLFLVEGLKEVSMALEGGVELEALYFSRDLLKGEGEALLETAQAKGVPLYSLSPSLFQKVSYRENPDGLLAVARKFPLDLERLELGPCPLVVVAQALEKPGNLGAILRCADAAGADAVVVCDPGVDPFNPNVVRASRGTLFTVKVAMASTPETLEWLKDRGLEVVITTPGAREKYTRFDYRRPLAVVVGNEARGLPSPWLEAPFARVSIPMKGRADSLNVAVATAVILYEALRQREED